jgi:hypothetical protein
MDYLPNEMLEHIFGFLSDKMGVSMVCKVWKKIIYEMHWIHHEINYNDSYCLKSHYNKTNIVTRYKDEMCMNPKIYDNIHHITNKNSINCIIHIAKMMPFDFMYKNEWAELLLQYLKINKTPNYKTIHNLIKRCDIYINHIFTYLFIINDHNMINMLLLLHHPLKKIYIHCLILSDEEVFNKIKNLEDQQIISKTELYEYAYTSNISPFRTQILEYAQQTINPSFIKYLQAK